MTTTPEPILSVSLELSNSKWKLAFSDGSKIRQVTVAAGDQAGFLRALKRAKEKLGLPEDVRVVSCYEAGRDGFWIHRFLAKHGIENLVVDAGSIEVPRRRRKVKTDRLDAEKLVRMLMRYWNGEKKLWGIARVPSEEEEDGRRLHRELERLMKERTAHRCRLRSLLVLHGIKVFARRGQLPDLERMRTWDEKPLPPKLREEMDRECHRLEMIEEQVRELDTRQKQALKEPGTDAERKAQKLAKLKGLGPRSSWVLAMEFFGWRNFRNRRQVAALAGLTGTPHESGGMSRDLGLSKAGNRRVRYMVIELAWCWLRNQPDSELAKWFWERYGYGTARMRRIGIVAVARKLLIALWKYLEFDEIPAGALLKSV